MTMLFSGRYIPEPYTPPYVLHTPEIHSVKLNSNDRLFYFNLI